MRAFLPRRSWSLATLLVSTVVSLSCGGDGGSPSPTPTNVIVTPGADTLFALGATQAFTATVLDANGDPIDGATVTWSSSDTSVVTILPSGVATARKNGAVTVTATAGALNGSAPITVAQVPTTVTISPATGLFTFVGDTQTFTAQVLDAGGAPVVPVQRIWTLNDNTVAVIDSNGLARAKGPGIAMVTVVAIGPGGAKAGYAAVQATQPVAALTFRVQPSAVEAGEPMDPAVQAEVRDTGGSVVSGYSGPVTISVDSGPAGAVLHGTKTVNAVNGVVSYSGLWLDKAGNYRLKVTASSTAPALSGGFGVRPGASYRARLTYQPDDESVPMEAGGLLQANAGLEDRFGNPTRDSVTSLALESFVGPDGGGLVGEPAAHHVGNGNYTFPGATIHRAGAGYRIRVVGAGVLPDSSRPFDVVAAPAVRLVLLNAPVISVAGGSFDSLQYDVVDPYGNVAQAQGFYLTLTAYGWPYAATPGRGQSITPSIGSYTSGFGPFKLLGSSFTRPGPGGFIIGGGGLIPDSSAVVARSFLFPLEVAAGGATTCAGWGSGLYCAGANPAGVMGVDSVALPSDSVLVAPDTLAGGQSRVAVGRRHLCRVAISGGTVACRGANDEGQQGVAGGASVGLRNVPGISGAWMIAAGDAHSCALLADSSAVCWGANDRGQLGRGTTTPFEVTPAAVNGALKWKWISAGARHTCGVTGGGAAYCWGANEHGQVGDSTLVDRSQPTALYGAGTWRSMSAGGQFSCGQRLESRYVVRCWGDNSLGQIGVAGGGVKRIPTLPNFTPANEPGSLATGGAHACVSIEATVLCWGDNSRGAVGTGVIGGVVVAPTAIAVPGIGWGGPLTAGGAHTCATTVTGAYAAYEIYCWGANDKGQLGDGTTVDRGGPKKMIR